MIPGEIFPVAGDVVLTKDRAAIALRVADTGDRPIQVGSHYQFAETMRLSPSIDTLLLGIGWIFQRERVCASNSFISRRLLVAYQGARPVYGLRR
jgi:urease subunit beta